MLPLLFSGYALLCLSSASLLWFLLLLVISQWLLILLVIILFVVFFRFLFLPVSINNFPSHVALL
jgi:hypothetical protein